MIQILKEAIEQHQEGQLDEAESGYRQVLATSPHNADALHYLGVLMHQLGHSQEGVRLIRKAINLCPDYVDAYKNLGNVLQESGHLEESEECYRAAIKLQPDDAYAHTNLGVLLRRQKRYEESIEASLVSVNKDAGNPFAWLNFGRALKDGGMIDSAIAAFYRALNLDSQLIQAHNGLCQVLYHAEASADVPEAKLNERINAYQEWLKNEPENPVVKYMLAACNGEKSFSRAPDTVIKRLFDGFAGSFDQTLAALNYSIPKLIEDRLSERYPNARADMVILDAGCGTGLCAAFLRPLAAHLVGVDLSGGMLKQASRRRLYDQLIEEELTANMQENRDRFDLIICSDALIYFGNLEAVMAAARAALKAGGRFIFSVELLQDINSDSYQINTSGRYSHSRNYVCEKVENAGLTLVKTDKAVIRNELFTPVAGLIVEAMAQR
jgi:predicted TPR repeat methyltransferase